MSAAHTANTANHANVANVAKTDNAEPVGHVVWAAKLCHQGDPVHERLAQQRACLRSRRQRQTRYCAARFHNGPSGTRRCVTSPRPTG
jgi:hypothetical protein